MNLFENINQLEMLDNDINLFAKDNGFNLLKKEQFWHLFHRDELKLQIALVKRNNKEQIELKTLLFEDLTYSLSIFLRPICCEKLIRNIIKSDLIEQIDDKIYLVRYINLNGKQSTNKNIQRNISSLLKKTKTLFEEISGVLDFTMFIKLN